MDYQTAYALAKKYQRLLSPACERILLVGSVRRADEKALKHGVHDIEFLLIPIIEPAHDLFGEPIPDQAASLLDTLLQTLKDSGELAEPQIARKANGSKFKKFSIPGYDYMDSVEQKKKEFCLELWIVTASTWGIQAVIRTGPSEFSYSFVNSEKFIGFHKASGKRLRGLLPHAYEYITGETRIIMRGSRNTEHPELEQELDLPTEESALRLLGLNSANNYWIDPAERINYVKEVK